MVRNFLFRLQTEKHDHNLFSDPEYNKIEKISQYDPILINNNTYQDSSILCKYYYMYVYNSDIMLCCGPIVPGRISVVPLTAEERSCDEKCVKSQWPEWNPTTQQ